MKRTHPAPNWTRAHSAATRWPRWGGSNVPPKTTRGSLTTQSLRPVASGGLRRSVVHSAVRSSTAPVEADVDTPPAKYGPFHRLESPSQTAEVAARQVESG